MSSPRARRKSLHRPPLCRTRLGTIVERRARRSNQILANTCDHRSAARGCVQANLPAMPPSELDMTRELRRPHSRGSWCACGREPVRYAATVRRFRHGPNRRDGRAISLILHLAWARALLQRQCRFGVPAAHCAFVPHTGPTPQTITDFRHFDRVQEEPGGGDEGGGGLGNNPQLVFREGPGHRNKFRSAGCSSTPNATSSWRAMEVTHASIQVYQRPPST